MAIYPQAYYEHLRAPTTIKAARVQFRYKKICKTVSDLEQNCLAILAHPESTQDQIMEARRMLMDVRSKIDNAVQVMREKGYA